MPDKPTWSEQGLEGRAWRNVSHKNRQETRYTTPPPFKRPYRMVFVDGIACALDDMVYPSRDLHADDLPSNQHLDEIPGDYYENLEGWTAQLSTRIFNPKQDTEDDHGGEGDHDVS